LIPLVIVRDLGFMYLIWKLIFIIVCWQLHFSVP